MKTYPEKTLEEKTCGWCGKPIKWDEDCVKFFGVWYHYDCLEETPEYQNWAREVSKEPFIAYVLGCMLVSAIVVVALTLIMVLLRL